MASQIKLWFLFGSVFALAFASVSTSASSSAFKVARGSGTIAEKIGWTDYLKSELSEWHDVPLNWELNATVPAWVKGQFIRNGPARLDMGGEKYFTMYMDGWGKLHSFKLNGGKVLASGKFTETELYSKDKAAHEILPAITLAPVGPKDWTMMEMMQGLKNGFDNTNTHVWRYGSSTNKAEAQYVAITDYPTQTEFGVDSLDFKRAVVPAHSWGSCAHPLIEPGTENTINYQIKTDWLFRPNYFEVWRYTKLGEGQMIAKWKPKKMGYIHSFSLTENFAIFFFYPLVMVFTNMIAGGGHPLSSLTWDGTAPTDIYVVNLKTGAIQLETSTLPLFSAHHINAYEDGRDLVVDLCQGEPDGLGHYMELETMRAAKQGKGKATSKLRRFVINMDTKMTAMTTPQAPVTSPPAAPIPNWITTFDFPTINEQYRGRRYCYAYGVVAIDYAYMALVKKSLCEDAPDKDRVYRIPNHYYSEANFIPNPEGKSEDDGVLVTIGYDGVKGQSYLLILDAMTLEPINMAYSPFRIPYSFHGNFFGEA